MRLRVPSLVLFLGVGMLVGSDALGLDHVRQLPACADDRRHLAGADPVRRRADERASSTSDRCWAPPRHWRPWVRRSPPRSTVFGGLRCSGSRPRTGCCWAPILSSTDGAAIFALLRGSTLSRKLAQTLEGESGLNDPVAVLLVLGFIDLLTQPGYGAADFVLLFVRELGIGLLVGMLVGAVAVYVLRRVRLSTAGLYPVAIADRRGARLRRGRHASRLGVPVGVSRGAHDRLGEHSRRANGRELSPGARMAGTGRDVSRRWDCWSFLPTSPSVALKGTVLALVLVFVARPVAVAVATLPFAYNWRERAILGWAGLRGAVPVVLATFPVIEHVSHSVAVLQHRLLRRAGVDRCCRDRRSRRWRAASG